MLSAIYGFPSIKSKDDPLVERVTALVHRLVRAALPGAYLVDTFPVMRHLPEWMAKWKREGLQHHRDDTEMFEGFLTDVEDNLASIPIYRLFCMADTEKYSTPSSIKPVSQLVFWEPLGNMI